MIAPSPFLRSLKPSPLEALTYSLLTAVLAIGINYDSLHQIALQHTTGYLHNCLEAVDSISTAENHNATPHCDMSARETFKIAAISVSILGFLEATAIYAHFYTVAERLELISLLRQILTERFLVAVEGAFSSIRTSDTASDVFGEWKEYTRRYAVAGRPLGAMLLQRGFMRLLVSCSSLQVASVNDLQQSDILDILMARPLPGENERLHADSALQEIMADVAIEELRLLEDGSDYLQLGSAWQQRLAFTVKAHALTVFLNCMVVDEDLADAEVLMTWLEDTMTDPVAMADEALASAVLKSMVVIAKTSPGIASSLSRSLPRFIVQGGLRGPTVTVAARCLAYILQLLSQDAVITGLYSLGNVLSAGSANDRPIGAAVMPDGSLNGQRNSTRYTQQSTGSAISLELSSEQETSTVYCNVVRAIVNIASICNDEKIAALAQSMLLQKLGRISLAVDAQIITEAAFLATSGGQMEFKSLLKLYSRFGHVSAVQGNNTLQEAVRTRWIVFTAFRN